MSSEKVNQYKDAKKNRKSIQKKQKMEKIIAQILTGVVCAAVVVWIGWSGYHYFTKDKAGTDAQNVHISVLDDYINGLERVEATP